MPRGLLPAALATTAVAADHSRHRSLAVVALVAAVPAAFAFALDCYGDALQARCGGARPVLAALALLLLVVSAALRSPALVGGVPQIAVSCSVVALLLYLAIGLGALLPAGRTVRV
jgi:hypothetical protein